jgi:hypothetical protein
MRTRSIMILGLAVALLLVAAPVTADSPWEEVEIQPSDSTECEFEPGVFTLYEVDVSTLPQFDRQLATLTELPDGTVRTHLVGQRSAIQFLKQDPEAPGPEVLIEWQKANLMIVSAPDGEVVSVRARLNLVERTPDGQLVDVNHQTWGEDVDAAGDPIILSQTGVCSP